MDNVTPEEAPLLPQTPNSEVPTLTPSPESHASTSTPNFPHHSHLGEHSPASHAQSSPSSQPSQHLTSSRSESSNFDRSDGLSSTPTWQPIPPASTMSYSPSSSSSAMSISSSSPMSLSSSPARSIGSSSALSLTMDHTAFPHILSLVLASSDRSTLLTFRATCKAICERIDAQLGKHLVLEQIQVVYPPGYAGRADRGDEGGRSRNQDRRGSDMAHAGSSSEEGAEDVAEPSTSTDTRPPYAIRITDPEGRAVPALPTGAYHLLTARQAAALALAKVVTLRGAATAQAFDILIPPMTAHTLLYRVRGYSGPLPRSRVVVPIPAPRQTPGSSVPAQPMRWSLGPARSDTLVLLIPRSYMGAGFMLHANMHREVVMIFTAQEITLSTLGFFSGSAPSDVPAPTTLGPTSTSPTPSPYPSAPSSPIPWARPPAIPLPHAGVSATGATGQPPLGPLRHIVYNMARTVGQTRFVIVGLEQLDPVWLGFPPGMPVSQADLHRNVIHGVMNQAWRGDWYGPADDMERSVGEKIEFITHEQYESRVGSEQYLLETRL